MIDFSKNATFNLKPINVSEVQKDVSNLYVANEVTLSAYKTVRDQLVFTNKRIIAIDVQDITGKRKEYSSIPYSKILYFSVQTPGFGELIPDCEMELMFSGEKKMTFEFKGNCDILAIGRSISEYVLD